MTFTVFLDMMAISIICVVLHMKRWWKWSKTVRRFAFACFWISEAFLSHVCVVL